MTNKDDDFDLAHARRIRAFAREKMTDYIGSPNLSRYGSEKPQLSPTPQGRTGSATDLKDEASYRHGKSVQQIEREVVGDSIVLKGKIRAMQVARANVGQKKQALKLHPTLTVPMSRNSRVANSDGATSFHFKHEAIAKTLTDKVSAKGTKTSKQAGRDHAEYLERESAVARKVEVVDREFQSDHKNISADAVGRAAAGGLYIEREEALAHKENGVPAIYSNISQDDAEERHRFWEMVENYETEPKPDHLVIITGQAPDFWEAVRVDPRCPRQLALAIEEADPSKRHRVRTDDNQYIREIMTDHGWSPPTTRLPNETPGEKVAREEINRQNSKGAHCEDGRGGHIQNRIVGELPHEVSHEQRDRIVRRFAAKFDDLNLPYVAVMHAPDHSNDDKNWHFHLAYYERPCSRFTGKRDDYLTLKQVSKNFRQEAQYRIKEEAFASGELEQYVGQWDFAVPYRYKKLGSRNRILSHPFAQNKLRQCNHQDWPNKLRKFLAEITNDELEIAGVDRRVDPRRLHEMGINKEAEDHIGSRGAQMECLGIATPRGVENEHRQWRYTLDTIDKEFKEEERNTANEERRLRQRLESYEFDLADQGEIDKLIIRWAKVRSEANEQAAIATELKKHLERAQSRALKLKETCECHLAAIETGRANKRQSDNKGDYIARLAQATDHLSGLQLIMAVEFDQEERSREQAAKLSEEAAGIREAIQRRLKDEMAARLADLHLVEHEASPSVDRGPAVHLLKQYEFERFMKHLQDNNRRLINNGDYVVPANPTEAEKHVIAASNYRDFQSRLGKLKVNQDQHIASLARRIIDHAGSIKFIPGKIDSSGDSYELWSNDGKLQYTFNGFADDPVIGSAIHSFFKAQQSGSESSQTSSTTPTVDYASVAPKLPASTASSFGVAVGPAGGAGSSPLSLTEVMRKIDKLPAAALIIGQTKKGRLVFDLPAQYMKALSLVESDLEAEVVQRRLRAMHSQQEGEIKRLVGFIRRSPARTTISAPTSLSIQRFTVGLARNAPPDLRALSDKYAQHPVAQAQMVNALHEASGASEIAQSAEQPPVAETGSANAQFAPGAKQDQAVQNAQATAEILPAALQEALSAPREGVMRTPSSAIPATSQELGSCTDSSEPAATSPAALPAQYGSEHTSATDPSGGTEVQSEKLQQTATDVAEGSHVNLLVEKVSLPEVLNTRSDPVDSTGESAPDATHAGAVIKGPASLNDPSRGQTLDDAQELTSRNSSTPSSTRISAMLREDAIRDILRPRRVGHDGIFKAADQPPHNTNEPDTCSARLPELDPITAAKAIWAFDSLTQSARAALSQADKELHAMAVRHPLADNLRGALSRKINHRKALPDTMLPQATPLSKSEDFTAGRVSATQAADQQQAALSAWLNKGGI